MRKNRLVLVLLSVFIILNSASALATVKGNKVAATHIFYDLGLGTMGEVVLAVLVPDGTVLSNDNAYVYFTNELNNVVELRIGDHYQDESMEVDFSRPFERSLITIPNNMPAPSDERWRFYGISRRSIIFGGISFEGMDAYNTMSLNHFWLEQWRWEVRYDNKIRASVDFYYNRPIITGMTDFSIETAINDEIYNYMDYLYEVYAKEFYSMGADEPITAAINVVSIAQVGNILQILFAVEPPGWVSAYFSLPINLEDGKTHGLLGIFTVEGQKIILNEIKQQFLQYGPGGREYAIQYLDMLDQHIQEAMYTIWLDKDMFYIFPDSPYLTDGGMFITKIPLESLKSSINWNDSFASALGLSIENQSINYEDHYRGTLIETIQPYSYGY